MILPAALQNRGFALAAVEEADFEAYYAVKKACYERYVDECFGGWDEAVQLEMNARAFCEAQKNSCAQKILLHGETVGFFSYDESCGQINGVSIQMLERARNQGVGSFYLEHITAKGKPISLKVFQSNPARELYEKFGFAIYGETPSHYLMKKTGEQLI